MSQLVGATAPRVPPAMMQQIQHHMVPIVSQLIDNKLQTNQMQAPPAPHASHAFSQRGVAMSLQGTSPFACVSQRAPSPSAKSEAETEPRCRESPPRLYGELSSAGGQVKRENVSPADARMSREEASSAVAPPTGNLHDSDVDSLDSDEKRMQDGLTERSKRLKQIKQRKRREEDEEEDEDEKDERKGADGVSGGAPGAKVAKKRPAAAKGGVIKRPAASMRDASSADHAKPATLPKPLMGPQGTDPVCLPRRQDLGEHDERGLSSVPSPHVEQPQRPPHRVDAGQPRGPSSCLGEGASVHRRYSLVSERCSMRGWRLVASICWLYCARAKPCRRIEISRGVGRARTTRLHTCMRSDSRSKLAARTVMHIFLAIVRYKAVPLKQHLE